MASISGKSMACKENTVYNINYTAKQCLQLASQLISTCTHDSETSILVLLVWLNIDPPAAKQYSTLDLSSCNTVGQYQRGIIQSTDEQLCSIKCTVQ